MTLASDGAEDGSGKDEAAHRVALETRNLEINLFWRQSLFFWGFISVAFAGYVALRLRTPWMALVIACFGMVCSFAWVLINRGSKYWQEAWEAQVARSEDAVTGPLFKLGYEGHDQADSPLIGAKRFSVSRVTIALSIYVFLVWLGLVLWDVVSVLFPLDVIFVMPAFVLFSFAYLLVLYAQRGNGKKDGQGIALPRR